MSDHELNLQLVTAFVCGRGCIDAKGHKWDGPVIELEHGASVSCSKCGQLAIDADLMEAL